MRVQGLGETEKLNQSLVKMHSFPISKWAPKVKLMLSEKKNANLEGLLSALVTGSVPGS